MCAELSVCGATKGSHSISKILINSLRELSERSLNGANELRESTNLFFHKLLGTRFNKSFTRVQVCIHAVYNAALKRKIQYFCQSHDVSHARFPHTMQLSNNTKDIFLYKVVWVYYGMCDVTTTFLKYLKDLDILVFSSRIKINFRGWFFF